MPDLQVQAFFGQPAQAADQQRATVHLGLHAATGHRLQTFCGRQGQTQFAGRMHHGLCQRVFAAALHGSRQGQPFVVLHAGSGHMAQQTRLAHGERAGLVKGHGLNPVGDFERLGILDEDAMPGRDPGAGHDGSRCGQAQRTGTCDHEHGHGMDDGAFRAGTGDPPGHQRDQGGQQHRRHKNFRDAIHQALDRRLGGLRVFHHADDAGQHGLGAHGAHLHHHPAIPVDRPTGQGVAHALADRQGFACEHGFVHLGLPFEHVAIDRHTFSGPHHQSVALHHFMQGHIDFAVRTQPMGAFRAQGLQGANGFGGLAFRAGFEPFAQQHQRDHHRRTFKIKMRLVARRGREPKPHRQQPACRGADRHQQVHVAAQGSRRVPARLVKASPQHELHRRGQHKLPPGGQHQVFPPKARQHGQDQWRRQQQTQAHRGEAGPVSRGWPPR